MRAIWPKSKPLFVHISAVDGCRAGVWIEDSVIFAKELARFGVDVVDCSSGGIGKPCQYRNGYGHHPCRFVRALGLTIPLARVHSAESQSVGSEVGSTLAIGPFSFPRNANIAIHMNNHIAPVALEKAHRLINHGPTVLVSACHNGVDNVMAAAWACALDFSPPKLTVVLDKIAKTRELVEKSGTFVIQVPTAAQLQMTHEVGSRSLYPHQRFAS